MSATTAAVPGSEKFYEVLPPVEGKQVFRCTVCGLVQFKGAKAICRACKCQFQEPESSEEWTENLRAKAATAVRYFRKRKCLSQRSLASRLTVSLAMLQRIERGEAMLTVLDVCIVARALEIPAVHFVVLMELGPHLYEAFEMLPRLGVRQIRQVIEMARRVAS